MAAQHGNVAVASLLLNTAEIDPNPVNSSSVLLLFMCPSSTSPRESKTRVCCRPS
jgi:hypothetical protein